MRRGVGFNRKDFEVVFIIWDFDFEGDGVFVEFYIRKR